MHVISTILSSLNTNELGNGLHIVIHNPAYVPPHIFLVYNKKYYSLTYNKSVVAHDFIKLLNLFNSKKTPLLIIELECTYSDEVEEKIATEFKNSKLVGVDDTTCLTPIKEAFSTVFTIPFKQIHFIYEMIPFLKSHKLIKSIKHQYLDDKITNGVFILNNYNYTDIQNKIKNYQLKNKYASPYTDQF